MKFLRLLPGLFKEGDSRREAFHEPGEYVRVYCTNPNCPKKGAYIDSGQVKMHSEYEFQCKFCKTKWTRKFGCDKCDPEVDLGSENHLEAVCASPSKYESRMLDMLMDSEHQKRAMEAINDYTREKMKEAGFLSRILPPVSITDDELDRAVDTDKPVKIK